MEGQMAEASKGDAASDVDTAQKRERSAIGFPYQDLAESLEAARTIYSHVGTGTCEEPQLAAWLGLSPNSSGFRVRLSSARLFNLIEGGSGSVRCTDLGVRAADSKQERAAKVEAFLRIPLYAALYERFKAGSLPPASAVEREMVSLGVAEKQKDRARQVFYRSAEQAGFFESGKDRLVKPGVAPASGGSGLEEPEAPIAQHGGGGGAGGTLDPLLRALIEKLPASGTQWPTDDRVMWLQMITMAFQMSYGQDAAIQIKKVDSNSAAAG
jgi:hypothetical protein